ncbi:MAG: flippase-like domain-containing protein [Deltaproteobacteria bacterium]|nr:flippase-like domain-containing protein [Deltaproteobacteria bacterium]MBW2658016.1 flippase-like domain-containing protein [Deltaproteobacteria bacterium]
MLGFLLLLFLLSKISFAELTHTLKNADLVLLVPAYALNLLMLGLMAYRWQVLYRISAESERPGYGQVVSASFIGVFFNNFLPSTIGGDTYRTLLMSRSFPKDGLVKSLSVVYIDRLVGFLGMALVGLGALFFIGDEEVLPTRYMVAVVFIFLFISISLVLSISSRFQVVVLTFLSKLFRNRGDSILKKLERLFSYLSMYTLRRDLLGTALLLSVLLRLIWFFGCYIVSLSLQLEIPLNAFFIMLPLIELIRMIPLTFQGIGVREGLFVLFFGYYGVCPSDAILLAVIIYLLLNINGLVGGVLYLYSKMTQEASV